MSRFLVEGIPHKLLRLCVCLSPEIDDTRNFCGPTFEGPKGRARGMLRAWKLLGKERDAFACCVREGKKDFGERLHSDLQQFCNGSNLLLTFLIILYTHKQACLALASSQPIRLPPYVHIGLLGVGGVCKARNLEAEAYADR